MERHLEHYEVNGEHYINTIQHMIRKILGKDFPRL
jgi:hypothetical protein